MKKIRNLLLALVFTISTSFANEAGIPLFIIPAMQAIAISASVPLAATPYFFKDNTTYYNYLTTLRYATIYTLTISSITFLATQDYEIFTGSLFIAPIIGTIVGFNTSKDKQRRIGRKRLYAGIGSSIFSSEHDFQVPMEMGYGITENLLIHLSFEAINKTKASRTNFMHGIGVSYYMRNNKYIKFIFGNASISVSDDPKNNLHTKEFRNNMPDYAATSITYGHPISKRLSIEFNYINLFFHDSSNLNIPFDAPGNIDMFNIFINYRWL